MRWQVPDLRCEPQPINEELTVDRSDQSDAASSGAASIHRLSADGASAGGDAAAASSDHALMSAYAAGDPRAFEMLYSRHKGALYRYFLRQLDADRAGDCFQTLWLKLIDNRHRYRPDAPFTHYLFTLAHNVLMDHYRKTRWTAPAPNPSTDPSAEDLSPEPGTDISEAPDRLVDRQRLLDRLHGLVARLPVHQRNVWLLRQESDLSLEEIAALTQTSAEGVKSRLRYAKDKLKAGMARYAE